MNPSDIYSAAAHGRRFDALRDIPELLGAVYSADGLLLQEDDLGPEFFRLGSGVAGELFQTLVNFRIPTALVIGDFSALGERFAELAHEHAAHGLTRFFTAEAGAQAWRQGVTPA